MDAHKLTECEHKNRATPLGETNVPPMAQHHIKTYSSITMTRLKLQLYIATSQNEQQETMTGFIDRPHSALAERRLGKSKQTTLSDRAVGMAASQNKVQLTTTHPSQHSPRRACSGWGSIGRNPACNRCTRLPGCPQGPPVPQQSEIAPSCRSPHKHAAVHAGRGSGSDY